MAHGAPGRPAKIHSDGTVKPRKRKKLLPGEIPRPVGRPRKAVDPDAPVPEKRPRGRPRKQPVTAEQVAQTLPTPPAEPPKPPPAPPNQPSDAAQTLAAMVGYLPEMPADIEPLDMALVIMRDPKVHPETRMRCLQLALPYRTAKPGADKKTIAEKRDEAVAEVSKSSRFNATRPPLRAVGGE